MKLLYELVVAEMDLAVARFKVTVDSGARPASTAVNRNLQIRE